MIRAPEHRGSIIYLFFFYILKYEIQRIFYACYHFVTIMILLKIKDNVITYVPYCYWYGWFEPHDMIHITSIKDESLMWTSNNIGIIGLMLMF